MEGERKETYLKIETLLFRISCRYDEFVRLARGATDRFLSGQRAENRLEFKDGSFSGKDCDTWVFPSVQMGMFGVDQDRRVTNRLLESCGGKEGGKLKFGTGYFNPTEVCLFSSDTLVCSSHTSSFFRSSFRPC